MADPDQPQIYLITPSVFDLSTFAPRLSALLDAQAVACIRLSLASRDPDEVARAADSLRAIAHARDVALVIDTHLHLVEPLGLDGVHLPDGARSVRDARKTLGADAIVGAACGTARHGGISAAEAGVDYVSFGPAGATVLGAGVTADHDLYAWWSEMIEVPVVAEGGLTPDLVRSLTPVTDFFGIGDEIWREDDALSAYRALIAAIG